MGMLFVDRNEMAGITNRSRRWEKKTPSEVKISHK